jgi:hypothetical protein
MPLSDPTIVGLVALVITVIPLSKIGVHLFKRFRQRGSMSMYQCSAACNVFRQIDWLTAFQEAVEEAEHLFNLPH